MATFSAEHENQTMYWKEFIAHIQHVIVFTGGTNLDEKYSFHLYSPSYIPQEFVLRLTFLKELPYRGIKDSSLKLTLGFSCSTAYRFLSFFPSWMTSSCRKVEVLLEDHNPNKWSVPLKEDIFMAFMEKGNPAAHKIFGQGSLFSPFLFGKFFDPSDAFPLWEFDADVLLSNIVDPDEKRRVDWQQTDAGYVLSAELPEVGKNGVQVCSERGKVVEICGLWMQQKQNDSKTKDWKSGNWWEDGFVRRIELPEDADWRNMEASVVCDKHLEIKIPKSLVKI